MTPGPLIGVVHLLPLPGSPRCNVGFEGVRQRAISDARALAEGGMDAVIVENFHDVPFYGERVPPETVAAMAVLVAAVREAIDLPVGVNVLRNDAHAALGIAASTGASFIRVNVHVGAMLTDQGLLTGRAAETLRLRATLCPDVRILADVLVKHATPLGDVEFAQIADDTHRRGLADALIVTGVGTGRETPLEDVQKVKAAVPEAPVLVGSGITPAAVGAALRHADGVIVGTALKRRIDGPVDIELVRALVKASTNKSL